MEKLRKTHHFIKMRSKEDYQILDAKMNKKLKSAFRKQREPDYILTSECYEMANKVIKREGLVGINVYYWCKTMHKHRDFVQKKWQDPSRSPIF